MKNKLSKIYPILLIFCMMFTMCACSHVKSTKEVDEIVKKNKISYLEIPYYSNGKPQVVLTKGDKWMRYQDGKYEYSDWGVNNTQYPFDINKMNKKVSKSFREFLNKYNLTQKDLESYMKDKYDSSVKKYNKLSYKDKIIYANSYFKTDKEDYTLFLEDKSEKEAKEIYDWMMKKYKKPDNGFSDVEEYLYLNYEVPKELKSIRDRLSNILRKDKKKLTFSHKMDLWGNTCLYYSVEGEDFLGDYILSYKDNQISELELQASVNDFDSEDNTFDQYAVYLTQATDNVDKDTALNIVKGSWQLKDYSGYMHKMKTVLNGQEFKIYKNNKQG